MKKTLSALVLGLFVARIGLADDAADQEAKNRRASYLAVAYARAFFEEERGRARGHDILRMARKAAGEEQVNENEWKESVERFTGTVLQDFLLGTALEFRSESYLAASLGIPEQLARFVIINSNQLNIDPEDQRTEIDSSYFVQTFNELGRYLFELDHAERIVYYRQNIRLKSVPEMAEFLKIKESDVYRETWELDIGFEEVWRAPLPADVLVELRRRYEIPDNIDNVLDIAALPGIPLEELLNESQAMGVGRSALEFILHHTNVRQKGIHWSDAEMNLLRLYYNDGLSRFEIAEMLRARHGYFYRTEEAVSGKLTQLFRDRELEKRQESEIEISANIDLPGFKGLRREGKFDQLMLRSFLLARFFEDADAIAGELGCTVSTVRHWQKKLRIYPLNRETASRQRSERTRGFKIQSPEKSKQENQRKAVEAWVDHFMTTGEILSIDKLGRLLGQRGNNALLNKQLKVYAFADSAEFLAFIDQGVQSRLRKLKEENPEAESYIERLEFFSIFKFHAAASLPEVKGKLNQLYELERPKARVKLLQYFLRQILKKGSFPTLTDPASGYNSGQILGNYVYALDGRTEHRRLFDRENPLVVAFLDAMEEVEKSLTAEELQKFVLNGPYMKGKLAFTRWEDFTDPRILERVLYHRKRHRDMCLQWIIKAHLEDNVKLDSSQLGAYLGVTRSAIVSSSDTVLSLFRDDVDLYVSAVEAAAEQGKFINILNLYGKNLKDPDRIDRVRKAQRSKLLDLLKAEVLAWARKEGDLPEFSYLARRESSVLQGSFVTLWTRTPPFRLFEGAGEFRLWLIDIFKEESSREGVSDQDKRVFAEMINQFGELIEDRDQRKLENQKVAADFWVEKYLKEGAMLSLAELTGAMSLSRNSLKDPKSKGFAFENTVDFLRAIQQAVQEKILQNDLTVEERERLQDFTVVQIPIRMSDGERSDGLETYLDKQRPSALKQLIGKMVGHLIRKKDLKAPAELVPGYINSQARGANVFAATAKTGYQRVAENPRQFVIAFLVALEEGEKNLPADELVQVVLAGPFLHGRGAFSPWVDVGDEILAGEVDRHRQRHKKIFLDGIIDAFLTSSMSLTLKEINAKFDFGPTTLFSEGETMKGLFADRLDLYRSLFEQAAIRKVFLHVLFLESKRLEEKEVFASILGQQRDLILKALLDELIDKSIADGEIPALGTLEIERSAVLRVAYSSLWLRKYPFQMFKSRREFGEWFFDEVVKEAQRTDSSGSPESTERRLMLKRLIDDCAVLRSRMSAK